MISLSLINLKINTIIKNTKAKVKCTFNLVRFFSFSVPLLFLNPRISIQKQEVSEVMAPSTLGNNAEINAMIKMMPIAPLNALLNAIVGNRSSGRYCYSVCTCIQIKYTSQNKEKKIHNHQHGGKVIMFFCESFNVFTLIFFCIISWSSPVMAIAINIPPTICFKRK